MEPLFWPKISQPVRNLRRQLTHGQLFWREVGRHGHTVIFLHGSWHDGCQWSDVLPLMGPSYHCLAPDLIGFGESGRLKDKSAYSIAMQVQTLTELLDSLRLHSVVLVGHSLGAWVATRYALQHPQRVKGLCVLEPEGLTYVPQRWRQARWLVSPLGGLWLAIAKLFIRNQSSKGSTPPDFSEESQSQRYRNWLKNYHLQQRLKRNPAACRLLFQRRRKALEQETVASELTALTIPMVALQGENAGERSRQLTQTFITAAPSASAKVVPGQDELPSYQAKAIVDFLDHWIPRFSP